MVSKVDPAACSWSGLSLYNLWGLQIGRVLFIPPDHYRHCFACFSLSSKVCVLEVEGGQFSCCLHSRIGTTLAESRIALSMLLPQSVWGFWPEPLLGQNFWTHFSFLLANLCGSASKLAKENHIQPMRSGWSPDIGYKFSIHQKHTIRIQVYAGEIG